MAKRSIITTRGTELLASSSYSTGQYWWIGYYALAYVPNVWKETSPTLPTDLCGNDINGVDSIVSHILDPAKTQLAEEGDMIYNIFQGSLSGTGFYNCISDGSVGGDLFGLSMYPKSIKKHYRYVLDSRGNNTLVAWVEDDSDPDVLLGADVYLGTNGKVISGMPIPSPLYYEGANDGSGVDAYFDGFSDEEENGSAIYPNLPIDPNPAIDAPIQTVDLTTFDFPKISVDHRKYLDSNGNDGTEVYDIGGSENPTNDGSDVARTDGGAKFDSLEVPSGIPGVAFAENYDWYASELTQMPDFGESDDAVYCREFWKALSISNYNKFHSSASSVGQILDSDISARNMSKITKFFPIANYKVISTENGTTSTSEAVDIATAISLTVDIDLAESTKEDSDLDELYNHSSQNVVYYPGTSTPIESRIDTETSIDIYKQSNISFKFNRIGLYAVRLAKCPIVESDINASEENTTVQFQIDPDTEPVLFAVADWDNTVTLDQSGDGMHQFRAEINLNLESGSLESSVVRDSSIYYNLYSDDAILWYQNQLVATASTQHAITELGLEIANIKRKTTTAAASCTTQPSTDSRFASSNHTHDGIKHLRDGQLSGSLRGINTLAEGSELILESVHDVTPSIATYTYELGANSMVLGGANNYIHAVSDSIIGGGVGNSIYGTTGNIYDTEVTNIFAGGEVATSSGILAGERNSMGNYVANGVIGAGLNNNIENAINSAILAGSYNEIHADVDAHIWYLRQSDAVIGGGRYNVIDGASMGSFIGGGNTNIIQSTSGSDWHNFNNFIGAGNANLLDLTTNSAILGGDTNIISAATYSNISGGAQNYIGAGGSGNAIGGGYGNQILTGDSNQGVIGGGQGNLIYSGLFSTIVGGYSNEINDADYGVASGREAYVSAYGQVSHSSGKFNFIGDAQNTKLLFRGTSEINDGTVNLALDGSTESFSLAKYDDDKYGSFSGIAKISAFSEIVAPREYAITSFVTAEFDYYVSATGIFTGGEIFVGQTMYIKDSTSADLNSKFYEVTYNDTTTVGLTSTDSEVYELDLASGTGTIRKMPSSWMWNRQFTGYYELDGSAHISNLSSTYIKDGSVTTSLRSASFTGVDPDVAVANNNLYVSVSGDSNEKLYWVADIDMTEIGIE